ncbi:MAG: hypothetical protein QF609_02190 [Gammaproteobacteria bacterium]|nr:hypothetical protein [Gammaproteobacteria bacterium]
MKLYRHWVKEVTTITVDGQPLEINCFGRSNESIGAASDNAREQASAIQKKIEGRREAFEEYEVAIREEIIEEIDAQNVVSRNRYGALVLNSENVVFIDIDEPRIGFWKRLFGDKSLTKKEQMLEMIEQQASRSAYEGLGFRVYETHSGMRLIVTGRKFAAGSDESRKLLHAFNSDPLYAMLCVKQQCYRVRLTPKPHRIQLKAHRVHYPRTDEEQQAVEQWIEGYEKASEGFASCLFVKALGRQSRGEIIEYHDRMTGAHTSMKLA